MPRTCRASASINPGVRLLPWLRGELPECNIRRIVDAKKSVLFTVTPLDNQEGRPGVKKDCAGIRACTRAFDLDGGLFLPTTVYLARDGVATRYRTGEEVRHQIRMYDAHKDFEPGEYLLKAPSKSERMDRPPSKVSRKKYRKISGGSPHTAKRLVPSREGKPRRRTFWSDLNTGGARAVR